MSIYKSNALSLLFFYNITFLLVQYLLFYLQM